jgi:hypothetical protein
VSVTSRGSSVKMTKSKKVGSNASPGRRATSGRHESAAPRSTLG